MGRLPQDRVAKAIRRAARTPKPFTGYCFRCVKPKFGTVLDAFSGQGAYFAPGCFHVKGAFRIVYANCALEDSIWENVKTARVRGFESAHLMPLTIVSAHLELSKTLDLTDADVLAAMGVSLEARRDSA